MPNTTHSWKKCSHNEKLKLRKRKHGSKARRSLLRCCSVPNVTHSLPDCISRALLAVTGAGLRWKSLQKQESVQAGATWKRSNMSRRVSPSSPSCFCKKNVKHQHPHHRIQHPHEYHRSLLVTATAVWHLIGNLKWNLLLPSEATSASFPLFSGSFPESFHWGLMWVIYHWGILNKGTSGSVRELLTWKKNVSFCAALPLPLLLLRIRKVGNYENMMKHHIFSVLSCWLSR